LTVCEAIAQITINRPHALNALDPAALGLLRDALSKCRDDPAVRVVVLTGAGDRAFCVGTDLKVTAGISPDYIRQYRLDTTGFDKPLIAAINGHCLGGGLELALQADVRIAAPNATFGLPEARVGSFPGGGGVPLLLRALPRSLAMQMLLTGTSIDATRALASGLVSDIVDGGRLIDKALQLAGQIATCAPLSLCAIRRVAARTAGGSLDEAYALTWSSFETLAETFDRHEGRLAFAEKRRPRFQGR